MNERILNKPEDPYSVIASLVPMYGDPVWPAQGISGVHYASAVIETNQLVTELPSMSDPMSDAYNAEETTPASADELQALMEAMSQVVSFTEPVIMPDRLPIVRVTLAETEQGERLLASHDGQTITVSMPGRVRRYYTDSTGTVIAGFYHMSEGSRPDNPQYDSWSHLGVHSAASVEDDMRNYEAEEYHYTPSSSEIQTLKQLVETGYERPASVHELLVRTAKEAEIDAYAVDPEDADLEKDEPELYERSVYAAQCFGTVLESLLLAEKLPETGTSYLVRDMHTFTRGDNNALHIRAVASRTAEGYRASVYTEIPLSHAGATDLIASMYEHEPYTEEREDAQEIDKLLLPSSGGKHVSGITLSIGKSSCLWVEFITPGALLSNSNEANLPDITIEEHSELPTIAATMYDVVTFTRLFKGLVAM
jgi:hypothetical protein